MSNPVSLLKVDYQLADDKQLATAGSLLTIFLGLCYGNSAKTFRSFSLLGCGTGLASIGPKTRDWIGVVEAVVN